MVCTKLFTGHHSSTNRFKLHRILLTYPVETAPVEKFVRQMKLIKTHLRNRIRDINLAELRKIEVEGRDLTPVDFQQVLDIFKGMKSAKHIIHYVSKKKQLPIQCQYFLENSGGGGVETLAWRGGGGGGGGGGVFPGNQYLCMTACVYTHTDTHMV